MLVQNKKNNNQQIYNAEIIKGNNDLLQLYNAEIIEESQQETSRTIKYGKSAPIVRRDDDTPAKPKKEEMYTKLKTNVKNIIMSLFVKNKDENQTEQT